MNKKLFSLAFLIVILLAMSCQLAPVKGQTYSYTLTGPFYDDGSLSPHTIGYALSYVDGVLERGELNVTGGAAASVTYTCSAPVTQILWSYVDINVSVSRFIDVDPRETSVTYSLAMPAPSFAYYSYAIQVSDFSGITNAYLQSRRMINGIDTIIEQRSLRDTGELYFLMGQWATYTLELDCDQGTHIETFMAQNPSDVYKVMVTSGSFSGFGNTAESDFQAVRATNTSITYWGSTNGTLTNWQASIWHYDIYSQKDIIYDTVIDGTGSFYGSWNLASPTENYFVTLTVTLDGIQYAYTFDCSISSSNDLTGLQAGLDSIGLNRLGVSSLGLAAFVICVVVGAIFSAANFELGAGAVFVTSLILGGLGFPAPAAGNAVLGGFIVFLCYAHKAKQTERDM